MAVIIGTNGRDNLLGTPQNDTLDGLTEADTLTGGRGADTFVLRADPQPGDDFFEDTITDFTAVEGDLFVLPTLPNGTQVTFNILRFEFEDEGDVIGTEIKVPDEGDFEEIVLIANVTPNQLRNPALFTLPTT